MQHKLTLFANTSSENLIEVPAGLHSPKSDLANVVAWVKSSKHNNYIFRTEPQIIHAAPETVWELVKDVEQYPQLSGGAVTVEGQFIPGNIVHLMLYKDDLKGKFLPTVQATIIAADKLGNDWLIGWSVQLPLGAGITERYQVLERVSDNQTRSYIADKIPGLVGFISNFTMEQIIKDAFKSLNEGFKARAEQIETHKLRM